MITILCPTRGRPDMCKRMIESARATADGKVEVILGIGGEDTPELFAENFFGYDISLADGVILTNQLTTVHVVNQLARYAKGDLLMIAGDDTVFATPHWDLALENHYKELYNKIHVYSLLDSRDKNGTPHPIATKEYVRAMGYFFTPIFNHFYADTWLVETARDNRCFTHFTDYLLVHDKPSDHGVQDDTYRRVRDFGWLGRDKTVNDTCQHFLEIEKQRLASHMRIGNSLYKMSMGEKR